LPPKKKNLAHVKKLMDKFPFALRTNWPQETNAVNKVIENLKERGIEILDLTASNPTNNGFNYPELLLPALNSLDNLNYEPDACGKIQAREAVAKYYAHQQQLISPQDIILTASTSEAYSFLMRLLVNPGEKVLVPRPSYPLFQFLLEINDVDFAQYPLVYDGQWHLDCQALEGLVDAKTKAIILVNPNNPTGSYISNKELAFLNDLCFKHKIAIISDEVFFDYALAPVERVSLAGNQTALTFVLGGLSKTMALPQMKCAWILASGPQEILQDARSRLEIIADTYLSVNTPVQNALPFWLKHASQLQEQIIARVKENGQWLMAHLKEHTQALSFEGGWYVTLRIPAVKSEEEWVLEFLNEDHVSVYPGYFFDFEKEAYIVLSLLPPASIFQEAAGRILKRLERV